MNLGTGFIMGVLATLAMTGWTELFAGLNGKATHVIGTLAHVLLMRKVEVLRPGHRRLAVFTHFGIGGLFGMVHLLLVNAGVMGPDIINGVLFGVVLGLIAILVWYTSFRVHPSPPPVKLLPYLSMIFTGHIVLSAALVVLYGYMVTR